MSDNSINITVGTVSVTIEPVRSIWREERGRNPIWALQDLYSAVAQVEAAVRASHWPEEAPVAPSLPTRPDAAPSVPPRAVRDSPQA